MSETLENVNGSESTVDQTVDSSTTGTTTETATETVTEAGPIKYCNCDDENCLHDYLVEENCGLNDTIENLASFNGAKIRKYNTTLTGKDDTLLCGGDYKVNVMGRLQGGFDIVPVVSDMLLGDFKKFNVSPKKVTDLVPRIVWTIDDPDVAYVTAEGQLGTIKEGTVTLKATNLDFPDISATMEINIVTTLPAATEEDGQDGND